jgi:hypothetical protein
MKRWGFFAVVLLCVPLLLFYAYTFKMLWTWFALPLGAPSIGLAHSYGLMMLIGFTRSNLPENNDDSSKMLLRVTIRPFVALALGWVMHQWM